MKFRSKQKILYLESVAGIAGDMFASSFVDAGLVEAKELEHIPVLLGLKDVVVVFRKVKTATIESTGLEVKWTGEDWKKDIEKVRAKLALTGLQKQILTPIYASNKSKHLSYTYSHWHTFYRDLDFLLEHSSLNQNVQKIARSIFHQLALAEAKAHGIELDEVAFHEVGAVDSIVDVAMAAYCIDKVGAEKIYASPVKLGRGLVQIAHGTHPIPPPASAHLSLGFQIAQTPLAITRADVELSTPTGLAILKVLGPEFLNERPNGVMRASGMGAGTMDFGAYPNVFRVSLLEAGDVSQYESDEVYEMSCNLDDQTSEKTAWAMERLFELGALDVWIYAATTKKSRTHFVLNLLCQKAELEFFSDWLLKNTTSFGVRYSCKNRLKLSRHFEKRMTPDGEISYKIGKDKQGHVLKEKPEYEDLKKIWDKL